MDREEAIKKIKYAMRCMGKETEEALTFIVPELAESEDERIRKSIIKLLQQGGYMSTADKTKAFAWLEKQKGPKPMTAEEVLVKAGLKPYKDGNKWCILAGDNTQDGICGFGDTIDEALYEFLMKVLEMQEKKKPIEKHSLIAQLKEYLTNTPKEQLEAKWKELEKWNHVGPTVEEYLNSIKPEEHCDLEKAAEEYRRLSFNTAIIPNMDGPTSEYCGSIKDAFIAGARWMENQFEYYGSFSIEDQRGGYWPIDYFVKKK